MADLQIARRCEQPLERDELVAQLGQAARKRRLPRAERCEQLIPAIAADRLDVPRMDRTKRREGAYAVDRRDERSDRDRIERGIRIQHVRPLVQTHPVPVDRTQDVTVGGPPHGGHRHTRTAHGILVVGVRARIGRIALLVEKLQRPGARRRHEPPHLALLATSDRSMKLRRRTAVVCRGDAVGMLCERPAVLVSLCHL